MDTSSTAKTAIRASWHYPARPDPQREFLTAHQHTTGHSGACWLVLTAPGAPKLACLLAPRLSLTVQCAAELPLFVVPSLPCVPQCPSRLQPPHAKPGRLKRLSTLQPQ